MSTWSNFLQKIKRKIVSLEDRGCHKPLFRGQADSSWKLLPGLARYEWRFQGISPGFNPEQSLYFDFQTESGSLIPEDSSSWVNLFFMQHYGLPTRLLDWTETFSVALYFAIKNADSEAAVWILDPFELNKSTINREEVMHPTELAHDYNRYYIERTAKLEGDVVAITPLRHNPRVFHQRAGFTLHDNIETPLEELHPNAISKIPIGVDSFSSAHDFLELAGINEFSLFPDLDGLARMLKDKYFFQE